MGVTDELFPPEVEQQLRYKGKSLLRKRMRGLRNALPASACAERSGRIVERVLQLECVQKARGVALFFPMLERHEVDLRSLDAALRERGVRCAYPGIEPESGRMVFRFVAHLDALEEKGFGFAEPDDTAPLAVAGELDVIVVPALALDERGHRLGYGAGYYDRTVVQFAPPAVTVGVAYDFQLIAEVPDTTGDVPVDWMVTDRKALPRQGAPAP